MAPIINGYWGEPTATIDWCENNYEFNFYIAEMFNTISNLVMIILPIFGMIEVIKQKFEKRFIFCHFIVLVVGLGSWAFHMTLLYEMQLFDELPMVWGICVLVYCVAEARTASNNKLFSNNLLVLLLSLFAFTFTAIYLLWPQPIFQHVSYAVLLLTSYGLEIRLLRIQPCAVCKQLFVMSLSTYLFGFFLWNIDNVFCSHLKNIRSNLNPLVGPFTQLHAWWHCLAGYGTYLQIFFWYDFFSYNVLLKSDQYGIHASNDFRQKKKKSDGKDVQLCLLGFGLRRCDKKRSQ